MWLGGTTVLIDQPYPSFPDNMGHWAEVLVPLYSLLTSAPWRQSHTHVDNIVFGNLQRSQLDVSCWSMQPVPVPLGLKCQLLRHMLCCNPVLAILCNACPTGKVCWQQITPICCSFPMQKVDWVWEMLKLVFAPATLPGQDLPRTIFYDDFAQVERREWLCIQEAIVIHDRQAAHKPADNTNTRNAGVTCNM